MCPTCLAQELQLLLSSLEIAGFKSFARPVRLELPPGITAVVGANGSGKSNLVDAVRWCLGEQSMRDLRAGRAEDVIHAGPRRVLGLAEVVMRFEGGDVDTEIARRLYRSGQSEYLVDRSSCRLRDLVLALAELGIDSRHPVVVSQGMAGALLSASPDTRRALLEQAAALSSYREQRDEARHKLAAAGQSIASIESLLVEIEPRLRLLRRQANAVREREKLAARLRDRVFLWYAERWRVSHEEVAAAKAELSSARGEWAQLQQELAELDSRAEKAARSERYYHEERSRLAESAHQAERERDAAHHRFRAAKIALDAAHAALSEILERPSNRDNELAGRLDELTVEASQREQELARLEKSADQLETELTDAQRLTSTASEARENLLEAHERDLAQQAELQRELVDANDDLRLLATQQNELETQLTRYGGDQERQSEELEVLSREIEGKCRKLTGLEEELHAATATENAANIACLRLRSLVRRAREASQQTESRLRRATVAQAAAEADYPDLVALPSLPGWERAIAAALGPGARESKPAEKKVDESFLTWRASLDPGLCSLGDWADDRIPDSPRALRATFLVRDVPAARQAWRRIEHLPAHLIGSPSIQIVSKDGTVIDSHGTHFARVDMAITHLLEAGTEASACARRFRVYGRRVERLEQALHARLTTQQESRSRRETAELQLRDGRREAALLQARQEAVTSGQAFVAGEIERVTAKRDHLDVGARSAQDKLAVLSQELNVLRGRGEPAAFELQKAEVHYRESASRLVELQQSLDNLAREKAMLQSAQSTADELHIRLRRELDKWQTEEHAIAWRRWQLEAEQHRWDAELKDAEAELVDARGSAAVASAALAALAAPENPPPVASSHLRNALERATERRARAEMRLSQLEAGKRQLQNDIVAELAVSVEQLPEIIPDPPGDEEIRRLRTKVEQQAELDPAIVAEFEELTDREAYLRRQLEDLGEASASLRHMLDRADGEMQRRFALAFGAVAAEFSRVFGLMLPGGEAELEETAEGVEIRARLPGRRARSSTSFSGGEKALVATALLFGVLRIRPSPFCVLDEVDAALDETNVDRYLTVLREVSRETQMIVVTHNRATMAAADVLYGATIDREGVTSLLSLNLNAYAAG
ncbi:MAG: AAA family ATPase [Chloroflexota bacterium]